MTKEEALEKGYSWKDPEPRNYQITMTTSQIPDHIKDVQDSILDEIIECQHQEKCNEQCTQAFRIIPQELAFLRKMNLPLPRLCPNEFETTYAPERPEIVYCEACYLREVV